MTWTEYTQGLEENYSGLHSRVQTAAYRALLSRRTYIPKADGRQRPLGIAALEDKTVQAAVVAILTPISAAEAAASTVDCPLARKPKQAARGLPKPSAGDGAFEVGERAIGQCTRVGSHAAREAWPASNAPCQRSARRHPTSPCLRPGKPNSARLALRRASNQSRHFWQTNVSQIEPINNCFARLSPDGTKSVGKRESFNYSVGNLLDVKKWYKETILVV